MPYESPNIVIVPTVSLVSYKQRECIQKPAKPSNKNTARSFVPACEDGQEPYSTPRIVPGVTSQPTSRPSTNDPSEITMSKNITKNTGQGTIPDSAVPKIDGVKITSKVAISDPTVPKSLNVLSSSNDITKEKVVNIEGKNFDNKIKINLISNSNMTNNADMKTIPPLVPEHMYTKFKSYMDTKTQTCQPAPLIAASHEQSQSTSNQQNLTTPDTTGFRPRMDTKTWLTQQFQANTINPQNYNFNTNHSSTNLIQGNTFIHYYTPSYKSPMDYMWMTNEYYTNLANHYQTNKCAYPNNLCQNTENENQSNLMIPVKSSDIHDVIEPRTKPHSLIPNNINHTTKPPKPFLTEASNIHNVYDQNDREKSKILPEKQTITSVSISYRNPKLEVAFSKTNTEIQSRKTSDSTIKKSDFNKTPKSKITDAKDNEISRRDKIKDNTKIIQVTSKVETKKLATDQYEKHSTKKRARSPDQTVKIRANNEDDSVSKKRKLTHSSESKGKQTPQKSNKKHSSLSRSTKKENNNMHLFRKGDSKEQTKYLSKHAESRSETQRKRIRCDSSSDFSVKKRSRTSEEVVHNRNCKNDNSVKSIVKVPVSEVRYPGIKAPEIHNTDDYPETDFDLRSKLDRINSNRNKEIFGGGQDSEITENTRENLIVTDNKKDDAQPMPGSSNLKQKTKKYKKIQLVINVICEEEDSSGDSSSHEEDSDDIIHSADVISESETNQKTDLSFLDDINIDEIVNSLKHNALPNTSQNIAQIVSESTKKDEVEEKKIIQPILIRKEIKAEPFDSDDKCEISHDCISDDSDATMNLGSPNNNMQEQGTSNIDSQEFTNNIKQEKHEIAAKLIGDREDTDISCQFLQTSPAIASDKYMHETVNQLSDKVLKNVQTRVDSSSIAKVVKSIKSEPGDSYNENHTSETLNLIVTDNNINAEKSDETVLCDFIDKEGLNESIKNKIKGLKETSDKTNSSIDNENSKLCAVRCLQQSSSVLNEEMHKTVDHLNDRVVDNMLTRCDGSSTIELLQNIKSEPSDGYENNENDNSESLELIITNENIKTENSIATLTSVFIDNDHFESANVNLESQDSAIAKNINEINISKDNSLTGNEDSEVPCLHLQTSAFVLDKNVHETVDHLIDKVLENIQTHAKSPSNTEFVENLKSQTLDSYGKNNENHKSAEVNLLNPKKNIKTTELNESVISEWIDNDYECSNETVLETDKSDKQCYRTMDTSNEIIELKETSDEQSNHDLQNSADEIKTKPNELVLSIVEPPTHGHQNDQEGNQTECREVLNVSNGDTECIMLHPSPNTVRVLETCVKEKPAPIYVCESDVTIKDGHKKLPEIQNNSKPRKIVPTTEEKPTIHVVKPTPENKAIKNKHATTDSAKSNTIIKDKIIQSVENKMAKTEANDLTNKYCSTKSYQVLAPKIETKILNLLNLELNVMFLIHTGKYSKVFKCRGTNDEYYALKFINKEKDRYTLGVQKKKMLYGIQKRISKQNLDTVYVISSFGLERNWCFLMEYYPKNLYETLSETTFDIDTVQNLARQLVSAVMALGNNNIVHSDIRPNHILLDSANKKLKLCGFDEAYSIDDNVPILPNIGNNGYRAPEVILGFSAGFSIDVWTTGLVIYEMVAGGKLFDKCSYYNNDMLYNQMCLFGYLPIDMIRVSRFGFKHFVGTLFKRINGPHPGQYVPYDIHGFRNKIKIFDMLMPISKQVWPKSRSRKEQIEDSKKLASMCRLLDKMLVLDPRQRIPIEYVYTDDFFMYQCEN